jgi:phospholipase C
MHDKGGTNYSTCGLSGIIASPFSSGGIIDSHQYETVSILELIERRFDLHPLSARDANPAVSDLTSTFNFSRGGPGVQ